MFSIYILSHIFKIINTFEKKSAFGTRLRRAEKDTAFFGHVRFRPWRKISHGQLNFIFCMIGMQLSVAISYYTKKRLPNQETFYIHIRCGRSVSRVLSFKTIIYLNRASLHGFSHLPKRRRADLTSSIRCCSEWGLQHASVAGAWVSSYLAFPPLPTDAGGIFLLHFP